MPPPLVRGNPQLHLLVLQRSSLHPPCAVHPSLARASLALAVLLHHVLPFSPLRSCLRLVRPAFSFSSFTPFPLLSSLRSSLFSFSRSLRSCLRLPIIFPRTPRARRAAFFVFSSMSTNNSLPFYPYFLFRFSPAYSRTAESPLFPHTHIYIRPRSPLLSLLILQTPTLSSTLPHDSYQSRGLQADLARALVLYLSCTRSLVCASARWRFFPMRAAFSPVALIVDGAMRRTRVGRLSRRSRNGNFNT